MTFNCSFNSFIASFNPSLLKVLDGVAAAFLPDDEKGELLGRVKAGITEWEKSIS